MESNMQQFRIPDSSYSIDLDSSKEGYLFIETEHGATVCINCTDEGIIVDVFRQHREGEQIDESPVATTWATWNDFAEEEE
jgi:hypothetical protein